MKFFWKIYFSFTVLSLLTFGFFGTWMIQISFEKAYQRVVSEGEQDNRMFQLSFEMNLNALDEVYRGDSLIPVTAASVVQNLSGNLSGSAYRIYNREQKLLYESERVLVRDTELLASLSEEYPCAYVIQYPDYDGGDILLTYACRSNVDDQIYFLESSRNISSIYAERESYYDWYTMVMLVLAAVTAVLVFLITHFLTRSIDELSQTTRRFTMGDYEVRASEAGGDEIAELACDFNDMADTISEKMEELTWQAKRQEDFTASFAHELKTPLTSIIGYADMLRSMNCTEEERLEAANYIFHQGKRLESLSFKLLDLIVIDRQAYAFRPISVQALAAEAVRITEVKRREKKIELLTEIEDMRIQGEKDLLLSVLTNLLDNARKAVEEGGVISIKGKKYASSYLLCIMDNGCGMEQREISRITEAFYMIDKSRARKEGGAGLGMTLCERILKLHHATFRIFSRPGKGTAVAIRFTGKEAEL